MRLLTTVAEVRAARSAFGPLGLVPTMGFLHAGHMSLVEQAKADCGATLVSIFVNPTQFGPAEDLSRYPRDLPGDLAKLDAAGVDMAFVPTASEVYPAGFASRIEVGAVAEPLEGARRPGHFAGVATVVAKLFNIVRPTRAYFGRKDAQQLAVIRRMALDLDMDLAVVACDTVREPDGLALSSRNVYLSPAERAAAPVIYQALLRARELHDGGGRDAAVLRAAMLETLLAEPAVAVDYVSVADPTTLEEYDVCAGGALVSLAVRIGRTRLIDNLVLTGSLAGTPPR